MTEDQNARLVRLIDLIVNANQMLAHLKTSTQAFPSEMAQYQRLKARYEKELFEVLVELGVEIPVGAVPSPA